jgi:urease accessory protein
MKNQIRSSSSNLKRCSLAAALALCPVLAQAHPFHGTTTGFTAGFAHPLFGLDHILAMVAVGLWAAQLGGRARWIVPATFVTLMALGGAVGMSGLRLPMVETGIVVSVMTLGVLIAVAARMPLPWSAALTGLFALFHGHSHGAEIPAATSGLAYAVGFVVATASLHVCGLGLGMFARKKLPLPALRYAGATVAVAGSLLWLA